MSKKKIWVLSLSCAALLLAPVLPAAESAEDKAPAKTESASADKSASTETAAAESSKAAEPKEKAAEEKSAKGDDEEKAKSTAGHKSPLLAGGLAFFPGVAVHGAGHMYAGSWMKGLGLLAIEGAAIGVIAATISGGTSDIEALSKGMSNGKFPTDVSAAYSKSGILIVSTMAFLWTWFDDMAGAPIAAKEYNKLVDEQSEARLRLEPRLDGVQLALTKEF